MTLAKNYLEKLHKNQLLDLAEFIVTENFNHHSDNLPKDYKSDVQDIYQEELKFYENSHVLSTRDQEGSITGAIRVLKWNFIDELPIQKIFGINPLLAIHQPNVNDIYHIGRFAVKKGVNDLNLFKRLLAFVAKLICNNKGNLAFAEIDSKLLRLLHLMGVKTMVIGESINYLGSETIPIMMTYDGVINFYNKYKHLIDDAPISMINTSEVKDLTNNNSRHVELAA